MIDFVHPVGIKVFICDFHREQAWNRWISKGTNGVSACEADVLGLKEKLRRVANALSEDQLTAALEELKNSEVYSENHRVRNWLNTRWFPDIKVLQYFFFIP